MMKRTKSIQPRITQYASLRALAPQHRNRYVTTDYCDVTSFYVYSGPSSGNAT